MYCMPVTVAHKNPKGRGGGGSSFFFGSFLKLAEVRPPFSHQLGNLSHQLGDNGGIDQEQAIDPS